MAKTAQDIEAWLDTLAPKCAPCEEAKAAAQGQTLALDTAEPEIDADAPVTARWAGPIGFEGQITGDGRFIEAGALRWENLPIPMRYVSEDVGAHDGAVVVGTIDMIERREGGVIWGEGRMDMGSAWGQEAYRLVQEGFQRGVSMDLDDVSFEVRVAEEMVAEMQAIAEGQMSVEDLERSADGRVIAGKFAPDDEVSVTTDARVRAATIVAVPAFADARISIVASGFSYNPNQARIPKGSPNGGRWMETPSGILGTLQASGGARTIQEKTRAQGGASIDPSTFEEPTTGYMVAVRGYNREVPEAEFFDPEKGEEAIYQWMEQNSEALSKPGAHIGLWHDTDNKEVVLDVSERFEDMDEAKAAGAERNQQAIWDVANGVEIDTGGTGDREDKDNGSGSGDALAVRLALGREALRARARGVLGLDRGAEARLRARGGREGLAAGVEAFGYNPAQARAPKGTEIGGQWIETPSGLLISAKAVRGVKAATKQEGGAPVPPPLAGDHNDLEPDAKDPNGKPYGPEVVAQANRVHALAVEAEPGVTKDLQEVITLTPGVDELQGLEYRVKEQKSLAKKIRGDMLSDGLTAEEAADGIFDSIRYTATSSVETHAADVKDMLTELQARGYETVQVKNFWKNEELAYKGINVKLTSPNGTAVELQFHTPESFKAKFADEMHGIYDKQKLVPKGSEEFWNYENQMKAYMDSIGVVKPDGADDIG